MTVFNGEDPADPSVHEHGDLYWRLHTLSTMLESSDIIDGTLHRDAYPTILDAMNALAAQPAQAMLTLDQIRDIATECDLDWMRGYHIADDANRFLVFALAVERAVRGQG